MSKFLIKFVERQQTPHLLPLCFAELVKAERTCKFIAIFSYKVSITQLNRHLRLETQHAFCIAFGKEYNSQIFVFTCKIDLKYWGND